MTAEENTYQAKDLLCPNDGRGILHKRKEGETRVCVDGSGMFLVVKFRKLTSVEKEAKEYLFQEQVECLCEINHVNLVPVYGAMRYQNYFGLIMKYYPAGNLKSILLNENIPIDPLLRLQICSEMSCGLAYVSGQVGSILSIRGGFKPEKVLISRNMQVKICGVMDAELGLRDSTAENNATLEAIYQDPKLSRYKNKKDFEKADVFSLGMVMHMVLCRKLPCPPDAESINRCLKEIKKQNRPQTISIDDFINELVKSHRYDDAFTTRLLADLMKECWEPDAYSRPKLTEVSSKLNERLSKYPPSVLQQHTDDAIVHIKKKLSLDRSSEQTLEQMLKYKDARSKMSPPILPPKPRPEARSRTKSQGDANEQNSSIVTLENSSGGNATSPVAPPRRRKLQKATTLPSLPHSETTSERPSERSYEEISTLRQTPKARYTRDPLEHCNSRTNASKKIGRSFSLSSPENYYQHQSRRCNSGDVIPEVDNDFSDGNSINSESDLLNEVKIIKEKLGEAEQENIKEELDNLVQMNTDSLSRITDNTFEELFDLLYTFESDVFIPTSRALLDFILNLHNKTFNTEQKLLRIRYCAESAHGIVQRNLEKPEMQSSIDSYILPFLQKCANATRRYSDGVEPQAAALAFAWCNFYLSFCCIYIGKYGCAEEKSEDAIQRFKMILRSDSSRHAVFSSLYEMRAASHQNMLQYDKAIKDYKIVRKFLSDAEDIDSSDRQERLGVAEEKLEALKSLLRN